MLLAPLLGETGPGCQSLPIFRRVSSSGVSAPSALSLIVPENLMSGGVSTAAAIPLQGFLSVDGVEWWYVGPDVLQVSPSVSREVTVSGDLGPTCPSPLLVPIPWLVLRWRATAERRSYEDRCRAQWPRRNRRVCCLAVVQIDDRLASFGLRLGLSLLYGCCCFG